MMLLFSFGANRDDLCLNEFLLLLYFKKYTLSPLCLSLSPYPAMFVFRARGCLSLMPRFLYSGFHQRAQPRCSRDTLI